MVKTMEFKYEMHIHTSPCSKCARASMEEMVDAAAEKGYAGFVITNHFYWGNTGIDRELPWEDFVGAYAQDYERGLAYGKQKGVDVFFGVEQSYSRGKELLLYGLTPEILIAHPEIKNAALPEVSDLVHRYGGLLYHAHPFRARDYIPDPDTEPDPAYLDGVEVYNKGNLPDQDEKAVAYAKKYGLPGISGGDIHKATGVGTSGIVTDHRLTSTADLLDTLRQGQYRLLIDGTVTAFSPEIGFFS